MAGVTELVISNGDGVFPDGVDRPAQCQKVTVLAAKAA